MKIEFNFRADMTVCELIQYLSDEMEKELKNTDNLIENRVDRLTEGASYSIIQGYIERIEKRENLIDDICLKANQLDRFKV
jgi:hypothetical protein